jgi:hypothetical protein
MLNVKGRLLLLDTPLHALNVNPLSAVASTVIDAPLTNEPTAHAKLFVGLAVPMLPPVPLVRDSA